MSSSVRGPVYLPRGGACVSCRRRKMRCDGHRPVCGPCSRARRPDDCEYVASQGVSTVQIIEENIRVLEARIQELQNPQEQGADALQLHQPYEAQAGGAAGIQPATNAPPATAVQGGVPLAMSSGQRSTGAPELPKDVAEALLAAFMPYATDLGLFLHPARFHTSMLQIEGYPEPAVGQSIRLTPCLVSTVYLWAIRFASASSITVLSAGANLEQIFTNRATAEAATALSSHSPTHTGWAQKVLHSIQAEVFLATYFFAMGRFLEGKYHVANAVATVLSAGLHRVQNTPTTNQPGLLPPPVDTIEEGERVLAAWTVFNLDKAWGVALDSNPDFPYASARIDTPWPTAIGLYEPEELHGQAGGVGGTVHPFIAGSEIETQATSLHALEAKAIVLWDRAAAFVKTRNSVTVGIGAEGEEQQEEHIQLTALLDKQMELATTVATIANDDERTRRLLLVQSILGAAIIRLNSIGQMRARQLDGARVILDGLLAFVQAQEQDQVRVEAGWFNPIIGFPWIEASQVLLDESVALSALGSNEEAAELAGFVADAVVAMRKFIGGVPLMNFQVQKIHEAVEAVMM